MRYNAVHAGACLPFLHVHHSISPVPLTILKTYLHAQFVYQLVKHCRWTPYKHGTTLLPHQP
jgi:hypothetical protein